MTEKLVRTVTACRICGRKDLTPILSLGNLCVSDFVGEGGEPPVQAPLEFVLCNARDGGCGLLQLRHTVSPDVMYRTYWYRSGVNRTMTEELLGIARTFEKLVPFAAGDFVVDIGSNDGTLLRGFTTPGLELVGFEPARNLAREGARGITKLFVDYFNAAAWRREFGDAKAKAIAAIAMFYDLDDPNTFVADIASFLHKDGVLIIQMSYLPLMLRENAFDNICHEHLEYYSLLSLENLLARHGLEVFDAETNDVNGGSIRAYVRHRGGGTEVRVRSGAVERVAAMREEERKLGLSDRGPYDAFVARVEGIKREVTNFVRGAVAEGKKVYVYGASTKGNTLLQYFGLDYRLITAAADRNPVKWGKKTVGTMIPIISEEEARRAEPDYFLVLPWHFLKEFLEREAAYLKGGGTFVVPLPAFRLIRG